MLLIENLFKDEPKKKLALIKKIQEISTFIADINDFPINLQRFTHPKSPIGSSLNKVISAIKQFSVEELLKIISKIDERVIMVCFGQERDIDKLTMQIVIRDVSEIFPNIDDYVMLDIHESKVLKSIPDLKPDKYKLIDVDDSFELEHHGIIVNNEHLVCYHPFLRRFFTSNFTETTLLLKQISKIGNIKLKIAIDPLRLSTPENLKHYFEADYWRGPKFSQTKLNDPEFTGITLYKRLEDNSYPWDIDRIELQISNTKEGLKEIQIEEIVPHQKRRYSDNYFLQKYAHLIWDKSIECFIHLDSAVKVYTPNEHKKRFAYEWKPKNINDESMVLNKIKLFRLDGSIPIDLSIDLVTDFFRYNELIGEFFGGK